MSLTKLCNRLFSITKRASAIKRTHPSADRNSKPISKALLLQVDTKTPNLRLLEIASGSGQHAGYLAPLIPNVSFQPSEFSRQHFDSIAAYVADCPSRNICSPVFVDISQELHDWETDTLQVVRDASYDYMLNCNMMHITNWDCSVGLFRAAGQLLKAGGKLFTYGPYAQDGKLTPKSNIDFDMNLKQQNADWGIRDISNLILLAKENGLHFEKDMSMPSNNKFLTWIKFKSG